MIGNFFPLVRHLSALAAFVFITTDYNLVMAVEFRVDSTEDAVDVQPGDNLCAAERGICTLRAAIQESNAIPGLDTLLIPSGTYLLQRGDSREDMAAGGDLDIRDDIVILGTSAQDTVIDANQSDRAIDIFNVEGKVTQVRIGGITIRGGRIIYAGGDGGCIFNEGDLTLHDTVLTDCRSASIDGAGGAIFNADGRLTLTRSLISDSFATSGGAIASTGFLDAANTAFRHNSATQGGGLFLPRGEVYLVEVDVDQNHSTRHGAGVHLGDHGAQGSPVSATILNSRITENVMEANQVAGQADPQGAGIFVIAQSNLYVENSVIRGNRGADQCFVCKVSGGGIYNENGVVVLNNVSVTENRAALWGGGIYNYTNGTLLVTGSTISGNRAGSFGGGIASEYHAENHNTAIVSHSALADNEAAAGGALAGSFSLINVTVNNNLASGTLHPRTKLPANGAALFIPGDSYRVHLNHVTFTGNRANAGAAEIDNSHGGNIEISASIIGTPGVSIPLCAGNATSGGNNIYGDSSCNAATDKGDTITDALLGPFQSNGGNTSTRLPLSGSPSIDAITSPCPSVDQRYFYRGTGPCDIGAVESDSVLANSGRIGFSTSDLTWNENTGEQQISIERFDGGEGDVTVDVLIRPESATQNTDFTVASLMQTLLWPSSDRATKNIAITLLADNEIETEEVLVVELRNATGGAKIDPRVLTVRIAGQTGTAAGPLIPSEDSGGGNSHPWFIVMLMLAAAVRRSQHRGFPLK